MRAGSRTTAGVFRYAVAATDLAGNAGVSTAAAVDVRALAVLAIGRSSARAADHRHALRRGSPAPARRRAASTATRPGRLSPGSSCGTCWRIRARSPSGVRIDVLACANPDGYARHTRGNVRNVDLNRNLPTRNWRHRLSALNEPGARRA